MRDRPLGDAQRLTLNLLEAAPGHALTVAQIRELAGMRLHVQARAVVDSLEARGLVVTAPAVNPGHGRAITARLVAAPRSQTGG